MGMNIGEIGKLCAPLWNVGKLKEEQNLMLKMKQVKGTAIFHLSAAASYFTLLEIMMNKDRWMMIFQ